MEPYSEDTCRICLRTQETVFSLFRKHKGSSPYDKLVYSTKVELAVNDAGPSSICSECLIELDTTVNFLEKCYKSNQILTETFTNNISDYSQIKLGKRDDCDTRVIDISQESLCSVDEDIAEIKQEPTKRTIGKCSECGSKRRCPHRPSPVPYICQYCGKAFNRKFNFNLHVKRHRGERDWSCPSCGVQQVTRWHAVNHCQPRTRRPCPFPGCDKTFTTNINLQTHIRAHKGERPFECNECGKAFTSRNTLTYHLRIHTGEKPYMCSACGARFATNKLSVHACGASPRAPRTARAPRARAPRTPRAPRSGAGPACRVCHRSYAHKQSLNKHMRNAHPQELNNSAVVNVAEGAVSVMTQMECAV